MSLSFAVFRLDCPACGQAYAHLLPDAEDPGILICPVCEGNLERGPKLTGREVAACGLSPSGGG